MNPLHYVQETMQLEKPESPLRTSSLQSDINRTPCTMSVGFSCTGNNSLSREISTISSLRDTCSAREVTNCPHFPFYSLGNRGLSMCLIDGAVEGTESQQTSVL